MSLLEGITGPRDLDGLSREQLAELADEIRRFLVEEVSKTGGHLGPNLGVVELTMAIHRVFDSPRDAIVFDTGHQSYVHKLLTGRHDFSRLRMKGGLAGYPQRSESEHDIVESSHASSSLSWADGISRAFAMTGQEDRYVVAVVGDGALTGGMTWEALNNISDDNMRRLVIVVNDNGRSYAPTIGGMARFLNTVRTRRAYLQPAPLERAAVRHASAPPAARSTAAPAAPCTASSRASPTTRRCTPTSTSSTSARSTGTTCRRSKRRCSRRKTSARPVIVHVITEKGHGFEPAVADVADQFHAVGQIDPETGEPIEQASRPSWTSVFADEIVELADRNPRLVGITAAMLRPTGLHRFAEKHPDRVFDVGIAEQHAVTSAAGLAFGGLHPVVALYATFVNRAFDQVLMDVALHRAGVTFVLDRAGVTGPDGPSHHGMWDLAMLQIVPGIRLAAPRDATRLREELAEAVAVDDGPTVLRFSKGSVGTEFDAERRTDDGVDVLREAAHRDVLIVTVGPMAKLGLQVAERLAAQGIGATVVDPRWVVPGAAEHRRAWRATTASSSRSRTASASAASARASARTCAPPASTPPSTSSGCPTSSSSTATATTILADVGLTDQRIARDIVVAGARHRGHPHPGRPSAARRVRPRVDDPRGAVAARFDFECTRSRSVAS